MKREVIYIAMEVLATVGILAALFFGCSIEEILVCVLAVLAVCLFIAGRRSGL
jgi:hypothetical protein